MADVDLAGRIRRPGDVATGQVGRFGEIVVTGELAVGDIRTLATPIHARSRLKDCCSRRRKGIASAKPFGWRTRAFPHPRARLPGARPVDRHDVQPIAPEAHKALRCRAPHCAARCDPCAPCSTLRTTEDRCLPMTPAGLARRVPDQHLPPTWGSIRRALHSARCSRRAVGCADNDNPTWSRILSMTARWVMTTIASMVMWQLLHSSTSKPNVLRNSTFHGT